MGASLNAILEYDDRALYGDVEGKAFGSVTDRCIDLTSFVALRAGKDYRFFAAISGWRNATGIPPLFPARGLPPNVSWPIADELDPAGESTSWLLLSEIRASLAHHGLEPRDTSLAVRAVLATMEYLVAQLGDTHVRLVFELT